MLSRLFYSLASNRANRTAWIEHDGASLCWEQIADRVDQARKQLIAFGLSQGDIVVTQLPNGLNSVVTSLAIESLGAWESPIDKRLDDKFVSRAIDVLGARMLVASNGYQSCPPIPRLPQRTWPQNSETETASILWTSGTTAEPKAVVHAWQAVLANAAGKLEAAPHTENDRRLTVLPLSHAYARTCDFVTWLLSGSIMTAADGYRAIEQFGPIAKPTLMNVVPYLIDKIFGPVENDDEAAKVRLRQLGLGDLRMLGCGGAALLPKRFQQIQRLGITPIQGYGLTETGPVICSASPWDARPGVVGKPIQETEIRIGPNHEIQCRGPGLMQGYWGDKEATEKKFTADGWFRTGDSGLIESDGMLRVIGRLDEVIVLSNGYKFWPLETERRLAAIAGAKHLIVRACGTGLEVIMDADEKSVDADLLERLREAQLEHPSEPRIERILRLQRPLSVETGELTVKNTIRREVVLRRLAVEGLEST